MWRRISLSPLPASPGEEGRSVHDDRDARAALLRRPRAREHVKKEERLPVADPRESGTEAAGRPARVLGLDRVLVPLPVLPVGRVGDQVVEAPVRVPVVGEHAAEGDVARRRGPSDPS